MQLCVRVASFIYQIEMPGISCARVTAAEIRFRYQIKWSHSPPMKSAEDDDKYIPTPIVAKVKHAAVRHDECRSRARHILVT